MRPPKASFVIPVYNSCAFLAETVDSCLSQTEKKIEVILVDDASTDDVIPIYEHYTQKDERVRLIKLPENQGRSLARNVGISAANSEIILINDADDIASSERAKHTINFFKKNKTVDLVYGDFQVMDIMGVPLTTVASKPFDFERMKDTKFAYIGHSTMAFRKKVFDKVQYTDGDFSKNAIDDWKFQLDAHKQGFVFGNIPKVLSRYRWMPKKRDEKKIMELKTACLS